MLTPGKTKRYSRVPTAADLATFNGLHCAKKYAEAIRTGWRCPSCGRNAHELVRWSEIKGPTFRARYADEHGMGFTTHLTEHHCHGGGRFVPTLICGDCNSVDGVIKRKLGLPETWSFSPAELKRIITTTPHGGIATIDYANARDIYEAAIRYF